MTRRTYRRKSDSLGRILRHVFDYQAEHGVAPTSMRAIGKAIGTSHTQARRLMGMAVEGRLMEKDPGSLLWRRVIPDATPLGIRWVPKLDASWTRPIVWERDEGYGALLDVELHKLHTMTEPWLVRFTHPRGGSSPHLHLAGGAWALVDRVAPTPRSYNWYLFVYDHRTDVGCLSIRGSQWFANSSRLGDDVRVYRSRLRELFLITAVIRPVRLFD